MKTTTRSADRYNLIDVIRALAIISMIVYHLCYDIFVVFGVWSDFWLQTPVRIWEQSICFVFIIVSGISLRFSHHPYRRGVIVNLCGVAVTVVSVIFIPSQQIWFGILNLLGCGMIITYALRNLLDQLRPLVGMAITFLLFAVTYSVPDRWLGFFSLHLFRQPDSLYNTEFLAFLGYPSYSFFSADYFPLIPWLFLFLFGWYLWRFIEDRHFQDRFRLDIPALSFIGRHSLVIYLVHQPVLYLICAAVFGHL